MTDVLHFPSPQSTNTSSSKPVLSYAPQTSLTCAHGERNDTVNSITSGDPEGEGEEEEEELSLLALVVTLFRKSLAACKSMERRELCAMEIGWPTNVRHVAHVTFDRFNGFLGLPVEFEPEVPRRAPSASTTVFGVSTESMQLSYDSRGNIVPTILLLMQRRLYAQGGLQAEGIFRINAENSQEEYVREQLNGGVVPEGIDVHCLAGLIKAWFRELPRGVLDSLSPEQVMECQTEEQCAELARFIPPTEFALLDWAINLMADVVQQQHLNKMNARNIAMVFAPNMTQMADPLNALMYAVQVMNFLKTLIVRTLREREDSVVEPAAAIHLEPFDDNGDQSPSISCSQDTGKDNEEKELSFIAEEPLRESFRKYSLNNELKNEDHSSTPTVKGLVPDADHSDETAAVVETFMNETDAIVANRLKPGTLANTQITNLDEKTKGISNLSCFIKDMRFPLESKISANSSAGSCILSVDTFSVNAPVVEVELLGLASVTLPPEPASGFSGLGPLRASFSNLSCSIFLMKTFSAALSSSLSIFPVPLVKNLRDTYLKPILVAIVVDYNIEQLKR